LLLAVALVLAGAAAVYVAMWNRAAEGEPGVMGVPDGDLDRAAPAVRIPPSAAAPPGARDEPLPDVVVPLSDEAVERAGILVMPVSAGSAGVTIRLPGVVEPDAYRQVAVTPLVAGRVTRVFVELGARVHAGQTMAEVYSPELAEAKTRYVSVRAELEAHDRELQRTERLVAIGAASRQELERIHAEHAAQTARLQSARTTLELLGVPESALEQLGTGTGVDATTHVPAPLNGVVLERQANVGLNVDQALKLFTVVDLSTVWVIADLYERDFSGVDVGAEATVTTTAYPELALQGRVSYIDPQVNVQTRTAKVRVEVPNPRQQLRLGMYVDVRMARSGGTDAVMVPKRAVQTVGDRHVVYLANTTGPAGFTEREVRLGQPAGDDVTVLSGLQPGDRVVTEGSFFVRAERERLGLRAGSATAVESQTEGSDRDRPVQFAKVLVSAQGTSPRH
jgi:cobalt-zinc-cadmium efflux system membrane fusion protein